jgi:hypothetical protein
VKSDESEKAGWPKIVVEVFRELAIVAYMIERTVETTPHRNMVQRLEQALAQLLADASRRGFYGEAAITLSVQDGRIQHIRVAMERMIK